MEIETRIVKNGNSYAMAIPKALVKCKILEFGKPYKIVVVPVKPKDNAAVVQKSPLKTLFFNQFNEPLVREVGVCA